MLFKLSRWLLVFMNQQLAAVKKLLPQNARPNPGPYPFICITQPIQNAAQLMWLMRLENTFMVHLKP